MENRVIVNISKGIDKGENVFFLYGEYIHDYFYYDLFSGVKNIQETLKDYFLKEKQYNYYLYFKNDTCDAFKINEDNIINCADELFSGSETVGDDSDGMSLDNNTNKQENSETQSAIDNADTNTGSYNSLLRMVDLCKSKTKKKFVFFFEDYEWTTGLYKSANDNELGYIEKLKELAALKNVTIIVTIEEVQMLKQYNFKIDGQNTCMISSPSSDEVYYTYLRKYIKNYQNRRQLNYSFFENLKEISSAVASGEKSLIESLRIFDRVMTENSGVLNKDAFESALDKHIEEKVYLDDVILDEDIKNHILERIDEFLNDTTGKPMAKGVILTGPPGTGKTFLVKALANEKNCYFMSPTLADLKAEYVGQTSPKIKRIFQQARANEPTIIFIDEADTVFPSRDSAGGDSDSFAKDMVNQFLVEIDGMQSGKSKVFVVAATNRINILDSAIKSRLGVPIEIPLPNKVQRKQLFSKKLEKENFNFNKFLFIDEFLDKTNRMSGRDINTFIGNLRSIANKKTKNISDFKSEKETKDLFYEALKAFESNLVRELQDKLQIEIRKPSKDLKYDNIIGCENIKTAINKQIDLFDFQKREKYEQFGIRPRKGMLLYGPPGNGKSKIANAAANEHNLYFMKVTSENFTRGNISDANQVISNIFNSALQLSELCCEQDGVLLFFDEFDSLVSIRQLDSRIRGTVLTHLDDENTLRNPRVKVLFMAATNFYELLDEAVIRAGRIDDKIEMENPSENNGIEMIKQFISLNGKVNTIDNSLATIAYKKFRNKYVADLKNQYIKNEKTGWLLKGGETSELNTRAANLYNGSRPSGADLKDFVEKLIAEAYSQGKINNNKLYIDEDVIDILCKCDAES